MKRRAAIAGAIATVIVLVIAITIAMRTATPDTATSADPETAAAPSPSSITVARSEIDAGTFARAGAGPGAGAGSSAGSGASAGSSAGTGAASSTSTSAGTGTGATTPPTASPPPTTAHSTSGRFPDGGLVPSHGTLAPERIRTVVRDAIPELRFCFEWQLSRHPDLGGRVTLEFRIAEDGTVEDAAIAEEDLGDEVVLRCFRGVTSRMRFPEPEGGSVTVRYPITLSAEAEPPQQPPTPP